ncbi:MAG: ABC transporter permease [Verrucomicrobia bacterium]|nr:MAG: ABC transporter permease [Verrucomicrobiota bacterium]
MSDAPSPHLAAYEVVIRPNRSWLSIDWRALFEFRDLLVLLVRREFVSKYRQTILGPAWFVLQPLLTTLVFTIMFNRVAQISTDGVPPTLFYLCGLLGWNYFSQNFTVASTTFTTNSALFSKVYFPRLIVPLSIILSNLTAFALQLITFFAFYAGFELMGRGGNIHLSWTAALLPVLVLETAAISLGASLWMAALTAKYRDLTHLIPFLIQLWMFASFVIVPLSTVPAKWQWVAQLNPMATVVEMFRFSLLGVGTLTPASITTSALITLLVLFSGVFIFQRTERTFIDTV